jgi:hypothetical protein
MPKDKSKLPLPILYEFLVTATNNNGFLYYNLRTALKSRFNLDTEAKAEEKYEELKNDFDNDPDKYFLQLLKSKNVTSNWIEKKRIRFTENVEKQFFEKYKDTPLYFRYCEIFNIIVGNYEQVVTEVALGCEVSYNKKRYLETLLKRRKMMKEWINEFLSHKTEITQGDSIKTLLENL